MQTKDSSTTLHVSVFEVYFDDCFDLLQNKVQVAIQGFGKSAKPVTVGVYRCIEEKRDKDGKWIAPFKDGKNNYPAAEFSLSSKEIELNSREELLNIMKIVEATRTAKSHALNDRSSRSHCLVTIKMTRKNGGKVQTNKFTFVDLAGSERIHKTEVTEVRAAEAKNINTSLSALGRVIN